MSIDEVTAAFFEAFTTVGREAPNIDVLYELFLPSATIVKAVGSALEVFDVRGFVEPRRALLTGGAIEDFKEYETSAKTDVFGNIAQRFSRYEKSWSAAGVEQRGSGAKSIQFVQTSEGWKIAALVWDDA
jgi:hypothetical protein